MTHCPKCQIINTPSPYARPGAGLGLANPKVRNTMSNGRYGDRRGGYDRPPREMHKIICSDCGQEAEVPFKPDGKRPVYCRDCFQKHRPPRRY